MKKVTFVVLLISIILSSCSGGGSHISESNTLDATDTGIKISENTASEIVKTTQVPISPNATTLPTPKNNEGLHDTPTPIQSTQEPQHLTEDDELEQENETSTGGQLQDTVICIDPGHGNPDIKGNYEKVAPDSNETKPALVFGTQGISTEVPEYKVNMAVSLKLKKLLENEGCTVILTRESDEENLGNIERAIIGNESDANLVIRIHADGSTNTDAKGISVLYPGNKYITDEALLADSKTAAQYIHDAMVEETGAKPRGLVKRNDLTGFNWSTRTTILIEMGFMTNSEEDILLNDPSYQDKLAEGMLKGILNYFNNLH